MWSVHACGTPSALTMHVCRHAIAQQPHGAVHARINACRAATRRQATQAGVLNVCMHHACTHACTHAGHNGFDAHERATHSGREGPLPLRDPAATRGSAVTPLRGEQQHSLRSAPHKRLHSMLRGRTIVHSFGSAKHTLRPPAGRRPPPRPSLAPSLLCAAGLSASVCVPRTTRRATAPLLRHRLPLRWPARWSWTPADRVRRCCGVPGNAQDGREL